MLYVPQSCCCIHNPPPPIDFSHSRPSGVGFLGESIVAITSVPFLWYPSLSTGGNSFLILWDYSYHKHPIPASTLLLILLPFDGDDCPEYIYSDGTHHHNFRRIEPPAHMSLHALQLQCHFRPFYPSHILSYSCLDGVDFCGEDHPGKNFHIFFKSFYSSCWWFDIVSSTGLQMPCTPDTTWLSWREGYIQYSTPFIESSLPVQWVIIIVS